MLSPKRAHLYIDGESGRGYRHKVKDFFRQNLPKSAILKIKYRDSRSDNLIQLADMIAGAVMYSVGEHENANMFEKIIKKHIIDKTTDI